jgi:hypothetical protein
MKIMGELCGALVYYAHQYVNQNIDRYSPVRELEWHKRYKSCNSARIRYIYTLVESMTSKNNGNICEICAGKQCNGKQDGCRDGIKKFVMKETGRHSPLSRYTGDEHDKYYNFLDSRFDAEQDYYEKYVDIFTANFPGLTIYQAAGYVFTWLCTRNQKFIYYFTNDNKTNSEYNRERSYENLHDSEKEQALKLVKTQMMKETIENNGDIDDITDGKVLYYAQNCVYFYENCVLRFEY